MFGLEMSLPGASCVPNGRPSSSQPVATAKATMQKDLNTSKPRTNTQ
jgi:hypothetical protein